MNPKLRFEIFNRDNFTCQYCGRESPNVTLEIDHVIPKSKGGKDEIENYVTSCVECNIGKSDKIMTSKTIQKLQSKSLTPNLATYTEFKVCELDFFCGKIRRMEDIGFLSATDLITHGNKWRIMNDMKEFNYLSWYNSTSTQEFKAELEKQYGVVLRSKKGKTGERWMHPFMFIDLALAISPKLKIEVYKWLYDELIKYRNDSGDSYKLMAGALYENCTNKSKFHRGISQTAKIIQEACDVTDWNSASEKQLRLRDKIHSNISLLSTVLKDNNQAIRIGISKALEESQNT